MAYGYDQAGRVTSLTTPGGQTASFVLGGNGRLESASLGTSLKQVVAYDAANKTTSLEYSVPSGTVLFKETYAFDGEGNRTSIADGAGRVASFSYDQLNRLTSETDPVTGEERVYEYDPAGNRTRKTIFASDGALLSSTSYAYNQANELVSIDGVSVTHDANGNLINLGSVTYVYDAQNRLTAVKNGSETVASFVYDGQGRRISQTTASGTTFYHYAGDRVAYETDSTGAVTRSFTYSPSGIPVSMTYLGQTYWYLVNSHGDVLRLADSSGTVAASYRYDAWGSILESSGPLAEVNPYRYAGYRYDSATGLYFLNARYYNPEIGRFITRDVYLGAAPQPLTLNRYAYADGNPVNMVDPTGFNTRKDWGGGYFQPPVNKIIQRAQDAKRLARSSPQPKYTPQPPPQIPQESQSDAAKKWKVAALIAELFGDLFGGSGK